MQTFSFPSKSSNAIYTASISDSGRLQCDCRGWIVRREGKPRHCTHTKDIVATKALAVEEREGYMFVVDGEAPAPTPAPKPAPFVPLAFVNPMLSSPIDAHGWPKQATHWALEEKFDGHRVIVSVDADHNVTAWSRPRAGSGGKGLSRELPPHILADFQTFPRGTYDGELIFPGGKSPDVAKLINAPKLKFVVFDLPKLLGQDLTGQKFSERRAYLDELFKLAQPVSVFLSQLLPVTKATVDAIWARGGEGAILKRLASTYRPGHRSPDWLKVKTLFSAELTCIGFEAGECGPYSKAMLRDDAGIETTVKVLTADQRREIAANPAAFIGRRLATEYIEKMPSGKYRHMIFDHWI